MSNYFIELYSNFILIFTGLIIGYFFGRYRFKIVGFIKGKKPRKEKKKKEFVQPNGLDINQFFLMNKKGGIFGIAIAFFIGTFFGYVILNWIIELIKGVVG